jgi:hypothetical protein
MPRKKNIPFGFDEGDQRITTVLKHRLKDKAASSVNKQARSVNFVELPERCAETCFQYTFVLRRSGGPNGGVVEGLSIQGHTIHKICDRYVRSRKAKKKRWLRYRGRKTLGWV